VVGSLLRQVGPNEAQGAAYLYRKPATTWASATETQELTAPDGAAHDILGDTVAARAGVVVAGAPFATVGGNQAQGAVHLFRVPPTVTIAAPADGATFTQGQVVNATYGCAAASDGTITTCSGPVSSGAPVDTAALGPHTFTVDARDSEGGSASRSVGYTVVAPSPPPPPPGKPVLSKLRAKKGRITFKLSRAVPVTLRLAKCATRCHAIRHRSVRGRSGPNVVKLKLGRGRYKITATPLGGRSRSVRFRVVKHT
jgi:hypothetical protein